MFYQGRKRVNKLPEYFKKLINLGKVLQSKLEIKINVVQSNNMGF